MKQSMRNLDGFSEFQLGIVQAWAGKQNAFVTITPDFQVLRVLRNNLILLHWAYGKAPLICIDNRYLSVTDFRLHLEKVSPMLPTILKREMDNLLQLVKDLMGGIS